jgi:hypothetical protein
MAQPVWVTPAGDLGTVAENLFFQRPIEAVDPDGGILTYSLIAGRLPEGVQVTSTGLIEGVPQAYVSLRGTPTEVSENVTSTFAIRATSPDGLSINDRTFSLTVTGQDAPTFTTPAGSLGTFFDCDNVNITIGFTDTDPNDTVTIEVDNGELPPGLTINATTGLISGHISPISNLPDSATSGFDASAFDLYPFDFSQRSINKNYEFTLRISDGKDQNLRTFSMFIVSRDSLTADTTDFTADSEVLTADLSPLSTPYITNYPAAIVGPPAVAAGTIGTFRHDNFFAYQIKGFDCDNDPIEFSIVTGDSSDLPPGITFNTLTGWLSGYFPDQGATEQTFNFSIIIAKANRPEVQSEPYDYNITVIGNIENAVTWLTGTFVPGTELAPIYTLGSIDNGEVSRLAVKASNPSGRTLQFKLKEGSYPDTPGQYNLLPQGLQLLSSGSISGRVSFNTFAIDGGTTTFDKEVTTRLISGETTFDKNFDFTVVAYSSDELVSVSRTFRITVDREYNSPYNGIYIKAMPDQDDRSLVKSLIQNTDIIPPSRLYRADDPYFGVAKNVIYNHAYSLDTATLEEYVNALTQNHFRKKLILGEIKTAQALNADGSIEYEVVYSDIIDTGVNKLGESPPQSITLPYPVTISNQSITTVYPNSLINMRDRVVDTIGQTNTILPLWMTSKQTNGRVLGFTRAWVIAYTKPGESDRISYNIRTQFGEILNRVDFISDRYILDNQLTANWVPNEDSTDGGNWNPSPPLSTTFDTDFDISGLYVSTSLVADATNSAVFDRSLTVNGILVVAAGAVGGQLAVPSEWVKKVGRSYQLLMDPDATGIDSSAQKQMIRTLKGLTGTWHAGFQTAQRVGYNGGSSYSPNWLTDIGAASYAGYEDFLAQHAVNDMVWYKNSNGWNGTGIKDVEEVFEHIMHTIHLYGVRGGVQGSVTELNWDSENNPVTYTSTELFKAMEQAINNGMYDAGALDPYDSTEAHLLMKEYMYLLNWGMWEMSVFWAGGSLAPEWNDLMRTPAGILANNPLGYALFNTYFAPVLSKPNFATLNSIFQDNDQGLSGYIPTSAVNSATTFDGNSLRFTSPVDVYGKTDSYDKYLVFPKKNILGT